VERRVTLLHKGLFLALVPFLFTLTIVFLLGYLEIRSEQQASLEHRFQAETNAVNSLLADIYSIELMTSGVQKLNFTELSKNLGQLSQHVDEVEKFLGDSDGEDEKAIVEAKLGIREALNLLDEYEERFMKDGKHMDPVFREQGRARQVAALRKIFALVSVIKRHQEEGGRRPQYERRLEAQEQNILIGGLIVSIVTSLLMAVLVSRTLTRRLSVLVDNALRLASNLPLKPPITGSDEIAELDQMFHAMAEALADSNRKERDLISNAVDVICSIDSNGRFTAVNRASQRMLGYEPDDLIGTYYVDLVPTEDALVAMDSMANATTVLNAPPFDTKLRTRHKSIIDVRWSVHWSKLEQSSFCVLHNISERKAAQRTRQEVVAMITHDLRAPLTTIRHVLEMLSSGAIGSLDERGLHMCGAADQSASRMLALINDLLDIEKIKAGMMQLTIADVSLATIFEQSANSVSAFAEGQNVRLEMVPTNLMVSVDADRIVQVVVNLISNAVKFSPPQSKITVRAEARDGDAEISIVDQGRGIPQDMLDSVFERFQQVEKGDSLRKGGTGLGLAICKEIVQLHGGLIKVRSQVGQGSTFSFTLPLSARI